MKPFYIIILSFIKVTVTQPTLYEHMVRYRAIVFQENEFWCQNAVDVLLSHMDLILSDEQCYKILILPPEVVCLLLLSEPLIYCC